MTYQELKDKAELEFNACVTSSSMGEPAKLENAKHWHLLNRHCRENFDAVVEALDDAAHSLEQAAIALKESPAQHFYILKAKKMWKAIEKAKEVKV